ncbi:hypothetical protein H072_8210 [Dactylellina haptotyla CBS 200.50]|uniref:Methyltransferase-like protein 4 n=1 Tax=Dactylellina haptotyla (strain CBS 200.50) TaxID=1284197 RepID=S8A4W7_DACHA|nr:hypothetical protein H072_8210 [Dactylellina haptotyla CBS 200.50]
MDLGPNNPHGKPIKHAAMLPSTPSPPSRSRPPASAAGLRDGQPTDDVLLVDIPSSLSSPPFLRRESSVPLVTKPYSVVEPKSRVPFDQGLVDRHEQKKQWMHHGLLALQDMFGSCFPLRVDDARPLEIDTDEQPEESILNNVEEPNLLMFQENLSSVLRMYDHDAGVITDLTDASLHALSLIDVYGTVYFNSLPYWLTLKITIDKNYEYIIPPKAAFLLGPFSQTLPLFGAFSESSNPSAFDFILLDPPWPNRSAHRAKHQNSYKTSTFDVYDLFKLKVSGHLRRDGVLAIWITNNSKWRKFVFEKLFPAWKVQMVAEWFWVKITTNGEPLFDLENIARKPYESLILAIPIPSPKLRPLLSNPDQPQLTDKLIFATPDIHSRKPCLKGLIDPYLSSPDPRCCEIFARNLTEGWFSWGNEVLKGNWRGCWT